MLFKYNGLSPEEKAYHILYLEHMKINPEHTKVTRVSPTKIKIDSFNFCPYLEACARLEMDTRFVCKEIGEPSVQRFVKEINPYLIFSRNYPHIRPHSPNFCEEFIERVFIA